MGCENETGPQSRWVRRPGVPPCGSRGQASGCRAAQEGLPPARKKHSDSETLSNGGQTGLCGRFPIVRTSLARASISAETLRVRTDGETAVQGQAHGHGLGRFDHAHAPLSNNNPDQRCSEIESDSLCQALPHLFKVASIDRHARTAPTAARTDRRRRSCSQPSRRVFAIRRQSLRDGRPAATRHIEDTGADSPLSGRGAVVPDWELCCAAGSELQGGQKTVKSSRNCEQCLLLLKSAR